MMVISTSIVHQQIQLDNWRDPYGSGATNSAKPKFPKLLNVQMGAFNQFPVLFKRV